MHQRTYRYRIVAVVWLAAALTVPSASAVAVPEDQADSTEIAAKLRRATDPTRPHLQDSVIVETVRDVAPVDGARRLSDRWYEVPVLPSESPTDALARLAALPAIRIAHLNYTDAAPTGDGMEMPLADMLLASFPDDPFYALQWHIPQPEVPAAWDRDVSGSGVTVAILDSGVSMGSDLSCHTFVDEYDAVDEVSGPGSAADYNGHGTHVAGTVAQCTNNGVGVAGVAFDAELMPVRVCSEVGCTDGDIVRGIEWAASHGADIINMSIGRDCPWGLEVCGSPARDAAIEAAADDGIILVSSAGNDADESGYAGWIGYPAIHPDVIAVGAIEFDEDHAPYSNWGPELSVVAPGGLECAVVENDVCTQIQDENSDGYPDGVLQQTFVWEPDDSRRWVYSWKSGTSMASPHVAGIAALLLSANPSADRVQVQRAMELAASDLGSPGWDEQFGYGAVDADAALDVILDATAPTWPTGSGVTVTNVDATSAMLTWSAADDNVAVTEYRVRLDGSSVATTSAQSYTLTGLSPATAYVVEIQAGDLMGNWATTGPTANFATDDQPIDTTAPSWPPGAVIDAGLFGEDWVGLDWEPATDDTGVALYRVYEDGQLIGDVAWDYYTAENLQPGTTYTFNVEAGDAAGNWSTNGPSVTMLTDDWHYPDWPGGGSIWAYDIFEDQATVAWSPAVDNVGVVRYQLWANGDYHFTSGATEVTLTGLEPGWEYFAWVEAEDAAGNWSIGPELEFETAEDFNDTDGSVFEHDIAWLAGAAITRGCNPPFNDLFCPDAAVTRGQMAAFLVRALGLTGRLDDPFKDDDESIFEADIERLAAAGITRGCNPPTNDLFCPDAAVTRGQMAAFLVRALGLTGRLDDPFKDDDESIFEADIERLAAAGITRGCNPPTNDLFCPGQRVTREQMAAFLYRALG